MSEQTLDAVLSELKTISQRLGTIEADISILKSDSADTKETLRKILKCVSTENADFPEKNNVAKLRASHKS